MPDRGEVPTGVGIGYHPFLHKAILARPERFAVVELPLEGYLDEAQRALLDPDLARVGAVAAALPCMWRGSALSLGSAVASDIAATEAALGRLVARTGAVLLREDFAFRNVEGRDLGLPQAVPPTDAMARLVGRRCEALARRLPCRLALGLSLDALTTARGDAAGFVRRLAAATAQDLALDLGAGAAEAGPEGLAPILAALPAGRVAQIALTATEEPVWPVLDAVLAATGARSVVIRRLRHFFPLDAIFSAVDRAGEALERAAVAPEPIRVAARPSVDPPDQPDLSATMRDQAAFAASCGAGSAGEPVPEAIAAVQARAVWRERVAELYRAQQLARWARQPADWRV